MILTSKRLKGGALAVAMVVGGGGALVVGAAPAGASNKQVTAAGSFTTYQLMHALFPTSLNDLDPGATTSTQRVIATATYCAPLATGTTFGVKFTAVSGGAPNGSTKGKHYLYSTEMLNTAHPTKQGCVTIARSSSPPTPATSVGTTVDAHTLDYYAYALDGVAVMVGTNAGGTAESPTTISLQQVKNIYHCFNTTTATAVTTWAGAGLGTSTGTINRFWPQSGSGTRSVFTNILGFTPTKTATTTHCAAPAVTKFTGVTQNGTAGQTRTNEENTESGLVYATKVLGKTIKNDIFIYSAGKFVSQWNDTADYGPTTSFHNRVNTEAIGNFTTTNVELASIRTRHLVSTVAETTSSGAAAPFVSFLTSSPTRGGFRAAINTTNVKESNEWYSHITGTSTSVSQTLVPGVRYVYNVCGSTLPSYDTCKAMVGFDNQFVTPAATTIKYLTTGAGTKSRLCSGGAAATIAANGFVALGKNGAPGTSNLASSTCREFPGNSFPTGHVVKSWVANGWVDPTKT